MAKGRGKLTSITWPWAVVATVLVAGFMYWLYAQTSSIAPAAVVADTVETLPEIGDLDFATNPQQYSGRRVLVSPVNATEQLGSAAWLVQVGGLEAYPIVLDRPVLEGDLTFYRGDNLAVAGWVYALNDSILDVWSQRGLFEMENRSKLEGHATFFLVDSLDFVFPEEGSPAQGADS